MFGTFWSLSMSSLRSSEEWHIANRCGSYLILKVRIMTVESSVQLNSILRRVYVLKLVYKLKLVHSYKEGWPT
jgi:hypothetical protein